MKKHERALLVLKDQHVSYHLIPLYWKTCFNFETVDKELFAGLQTLTQAGLDTHRKRELL